MNTIHPVLKTVTDRITERSSAPRAAYLKQIREAGDRGPARGRLACANLAHGFAASGKADKKALRGMVKPNIAIVSAYNDMLSAHKPFEAFPEQLKQAVSRLAASHSSPAVCPPCATGSPKVATACNSRCSAAT